MSPSEQGGRVRLNVKAADAGTEIFVSDGRFNVVKTGCGELHDDLPRGIYQIKLRSGYAIHEEDVILDGKTPVVDKDYPALHFATPAPLEGTGKPSALEAIGPTPVGRQAAFINQQIDAVHAEAGDGSAVFVFVRSNSGAVNPARDLTLRDGDGKVVADLGARSVVAPNPSAGETWSACAVQVKPGCYRLSLGPDTGQRLEQTVVAAPDWQTQVFLGERAYGADLQDARPDLQGGAILYSKKRRFDPASPEARLAELARLGLTNRRQVLSEGVLNGILDGKFENPMLGLFGAHLLRAARPAETNFLRVVVNNLRRLFAGLSHPDVEALALVLEGEPGTYRFEWPPMLRRSWELVVKASADRPAVLPADGPAARVADRLWGEEPWLLWMTPAPRVKGPFESVQASEPTVEPNDYECALLAHLDRLGKRPDKGEGPSWLERAEKLLKMGPKPQLGEEEIRQLVLALGLPRSHVEKLLDRLFPD